MWTVALSQGAWPLLAFTCELGDLSSVFLVMLPDVSMYPCLSSMMSRRCPESLCFQVWAFWCSTYEVCDLWQLPVLSVLPFLCCGILAKLPDLYELPFVSFVKLGKMSDLSVLPYLNCEILGKFPNLSLLPDVRCVMLSKLANFSVLPHLIYMILGKLPDLSQVPLLCSVILSKLWDITVYPFLLCMILARLSDLSVVSLLSCDILGKLPDLCPSTGKLYFR